MRSKGKKRFSDYVTKQTVFWAALVALGNAIAFRIGGAMIFLHINYGIFVLFMVPLIWEVMKDLRLGLLGVARFMVFLFFVTFLGIVSLAYWSSVL